MDWNLAKWQIPGFHSCFKKQNKTKHNKKSKTERERKKRNLEKEKKSSKQNLSIHKTLFKNIPALCFSGSVSSDPLSFTSSKNFFPKVERQGPYVSHLSLAVMPENTYVRWMCGI